MARVFTIPKTYNLQTSNLSAIFQSIRSTPILNNLHISNYLSYEALSNQNSKIKSFSCLSWRLFYLEDLIVKWHNVSTLGKSTPTTAHTRPHRVLFSWGLGFERHRIENTRGTGGWQSTNCVDKLRRDWKVITLKRKSIRTSDWKKVKFGEDRVRLLSAFPKLCATYCMCGTVSFCHYNNSNTQDS